MSRRKPKPTGSLSTAAVVCALVVLTAATLLFNDVPHLRQVGGDSGWLPSPIARLLVLPVPLTGTSDLRWYAIPLGVAALLLFVVVPARRDRRGDEKGAPQGFFNRYAFELAAAVVAAAAVVSAAVNASWVISRGWIFYFLAGSLWAVLLARFALPSALTRLFVAGGILAAISGSAALWHERRMGYQFFDMPIGPVTVTATLAAVWACMVIAALIAWLAAGEKKPPLRPAAIALSVIVLAVSIWMLMAAGRRGAVVGALVTLVLISTVAASRVGRGRMTRFSIPLGVAAALAYFLVTIVPPALSDTATGRDSQFMRRLYWLEMSKMAAQAPLVGIGPDRLACRLTTAVATTHAESPQVIREKVDYDGHNEWLQAVCELGLPAGIVYAALPIALILLALRRWRRDPREPVGRALLPCAAGLTVIVATEVFSINLRHPILPAWYWTLMGVTLCLLRARPEGDRERGSGVSTRARVGAAIVAAVLAAAMLVVIIGDAVHVAAHERGLAMRGTDDEGAAVEFEVAGRRMGARGWLWAHHELAKARSRVAADALRAQSDDGGPSDEVRGMLDAAIGDWKIMNDACPAYLDTSFQYARALALAGREDEARACIEGYLTNLNPYDRASNLLFLSLSPSSAQTALTCVRRGLRTSRTDTILVGHALGALASEEVVDSWPAMVETARRDLDGGSPGDWEDPLAPETLRVEALRLATRGKRAEAAQLQRRVAMAYADLARVSPVERSSDVQSDTWYLAARFAFDADPGECDRALRMINRAERIGRFAIAVSGPDATDADIGRLQDRSPEARRLFELSAKLRLAAGREMSEVRPRVIWSMAPGNPSAKAVNDEIRQMAAELLPALEPLPADRRPAGYERLVTLAAGAPPGS